MCSTSPAEKQFTPPGRTDAELYPDETNLCHAWQRFSTHAMEKPGYTAAAARDARHARARQPEQQNRCPSLTAANGSEHPSHTAG